MKEPKMQAFVALANQKAGAISQIAHESIDTGFPRVSLLEEKFAAQGYEVVYEDATNGAWARVFKDGVMVAQGYSGVGREDALLYAVFGALREELAAKTVTEELAALGITVNEEIRRKLEAACILDGQVDNKNEIRKGLSPSAAAILKA